MHENIAKLLSDQITLQEFKSLPVQGINKQANITIEGTEIQNITPLGMAAYSGKIPLVIYLLEKKANPNLGDVYPLLVALRKLSPLPNENDPYFLIAKILIAQCQHININISEKRNNVTALFIASIRGRHDVVNYLIDKGADIHLPCGVDGLPPIFYAAQSGYAQVVDIFCKQDKSIIKPFKIKKEYTYIFYNTLSNRVKKVSEDALKNVFAILLQYITPDHHHHNELFAVILSAHNLQIFEVEEQICDYLFSAENKDMTIWQAFQLNRMNFLKYMLDKKWISLETCLPRGNPYKSLGEKIDLTLIQIAVLTHSIDCLKLLLNRGFDPNFTQEKGLTALYIAAEINNIDAATALLASGKITNINHQYELQYGEAKADLSLSPLHIALIKKFTTMVKLLLSYGADPDLNVDNNLSLTALVVLWKDLPLLKLLMHYNVDPNKESPLLMAIRTNNLAAVKILVANPMTDISRDFFNVAIEKNFIDIMRVLLNRIDISEIDLYARHLFYAIVLNREAIVDIFIDFLFSKDCMNNLKNYCVAYKEAIEIVAFSEQERKELEEQILTIEQKLEKYDEQHKPWSPSFNYSTGTSSHQYLKQTKFSEEEMEYFRNEIKYKRKHRGKSEQETKATALSASSYHPLPTWFNGKLNTQPLAVIENGENCFLWIPEKEILEQKCENDMLIKFANKSRYKFGGDNIKKIDLNYVCAFEMGGEVLYLEASHELKIADSDARILLFPVSSDNLSATLYVAGKFLPHGLHEKSDTQHLLSGLTGNPIKIMLPQCKPQNSLEIVSIKSNACQPK